MALFVGREKEREEFRQFLVHAGFSACDDYGVNVFFAALQDFQRGGFLQKRRLRVNGYAPVMAEGATQVAARREQHTSYFIGKID